MRTAILVACGAAVLLIFQAQRAVCADLVGSVADSQGRPVAGVKILLKTTTNTPVSQALSNANGRYQVTGLAPGTYKYILDPVNSGFEGGDAVSYLGPKGLTIDWHLSATSPPIALSSDGTGTMLAGDPPGLSDLEFTGIVVGGIDLLDGIGVGACAAAGCFSGSAASPSL